VVVKSATGLLGEFSISLMFVLYLYEQLLALLRIVCYEYPKLMHAVYASLEKLKKYREECLVSKSYMLAMG
jgi:hypothetical protein